MVYSRCRKVEHNSRCDFFVKQRVLRHLKTRWRQSRLPQEENPTFASSFQTRETTLPKLIGLEMDAWLIKRLQSCEKVSWMRRQI